MEESDISLVTRKHSNRDQTTNCAVEQSIMILTHCSNAAKRLLGEILILFFSPYFLTNTNDHGLSCSLKVVHPVCSNY